MIHKKNNILICSKNLGPSLRIKLFLEEKGFSVFDIISSGDELIKSILTSFPSLVITDITLKGEIDGIEAISRVSGITKVPYIFISENTDNISLIDSYYLNPLKVFTLPVDMDELYFYVNDCIGFIDDTQYSNYYLG
jgi:DNA-binding response OmpR family regulator